MGSLPQHSVIEFRRYLNRFVYLFPDLSTMAHVLRSQFNQHEAFVKPLVAWLKKRSVNFVKGAFVQDIGFAESPGRMTANRLDIQSGRRRHSVTVAPEDIVLVTTGSQAADRSPGTMDTPPPAAAASRTVMGVMEDAWPRSTRVSAIRTRSSATPGSPIRAG